MTAVRKRGWVGEVGHAGGPAARSSRVRPARLLGWAATGLAGGAPPLLSPSDGCGGRGVDWHGTGVG